MEIVLSQVQSSKCKAFFMTHEDDGIMEGINVYLYAQLWRDDWQYIKRIIH